MSFGRSQFGREPWGRSLFGRRPYDENPGLTPIEAWIKKWAPTLIFQAFDTKQLTLDVDKADAWAPAKGGEAFTLRATGDARPAYNQGTGLTFDALDDLMILDNDILAVAPFQLARLIFQREETALTLGTHLLSTNYDMLIVANYFRNRTQSGSNRSVGNVNAVEDAWTTQGVYHRGVGEVMDFYQAHALLDTENIAAGSVFRATSMRGYNSATPYGNFDLLCYAGWQGDDCLSVPDLLTALEELEAVRTLSA